MPRLHTLDAWLGYRNYRLLWYGNLFANCAQWLQLLSVGWLVRELSKGSAVAGLLAVTVGEINTLLVLIVGPWAGVTSDREDPGVAVHAGVAGNASLEGTAFALSPRPAVRSFTW